MLDKRLIGLGLVVLGCAAPLAVAAQGNGNGHKPATGLVNEVRLGTETFRDVTQAAGAGYASTGSCVTGPQEGAMGIHFANGVLIGDPALDPQRPELLIYEQRNGRLRLVGVEFLVIAEAWHLTNQGPPVLMGQHFQFVGAPNRYGLPSFYELHVWAWRDNANGMFVDWNPAVSCEEFTGEPVSGHPGHGGH